MNHPIEICIYADNTSHVNKLGFKRFLFESETASFLQEFNIPEERDYDYPAMFFCLKDKEITLRIFGAKEPVIRPTRITGKRWEPIHD